MPVVRQPTVAPDGSRRNLRAFPRFEEPPLATVAIQGSDLEWRCQGESLIDRVPSGLSAILPYAESSPSERQLPVCRLTAQNTSSAMVNAIAAVDTGGRCAVSSLS
jgi:hypothetical protein